MATQINAEATRRNVERVQQVLETLKQDAQAAAQAKDAYMLSVYEGLPVADGQKATLSIAVVVSTVDLPCF